MDFKKIDKIIEGLDKNVNNILKLNPSQSELKRLLSGYSDMVLSMGVEPDCCAMYQYIDNLIDEEI